MDEFDNGCESLQEGNLLDAGRIFKSVLSQMPEHLDAGRFGFGVVTGSKNLKVVVVRATF